MPLKEKFFSFINLLENRIAPYILIFLAVFAISLIVYKADWLMGDNYLFLKTTAQNKPAPILNPVNIGNSRFFPLAGLDFNLLLLLPGETGCSPMAHYIYVAVSFAAMYVFFLLALKTFLKENKRFPISLAAFSALLLIINKSFFMTFLNVNYAERMISLLFIAFIYFYIRASESETKEQGFNRWYIAALLCAFLSTYLKETVFAFYFTFAFVSICLFYKKMSCAQKKANIMLLVNGIIFLAFYFHFAFAPGSGQIYRPDYSLGTASIAASLFSNIKIYYFFLLIIIARIAGMAFFKSKPVPIFDPLLAASAVYSMEYIILGFNDYYYYFPSVIAGIVPLSYFIARHYESAYMRPKSFFHKAAYLFIFLLAMLPFFEFPKVSALAKITIHDRENTMPGLRLIAGHYANGGKIYWYQPIENERKMLELTVFYLNYILGNKEAVLISRINSLNNIDFASKDVFMYCVADGHGGFNADETMLKKLEEKGFKFNRYLADSLVYFKE